MIGGFLGPYHVLAKLGEGGMGEVYRATDSRLKRQVAVKILPSGVAADPTADGSSIGFWVGSTLKRVPVGGGQAAAIAEIAEGNRGSATWADDGTIFVASAAGISRVPSGGGTPAALIWSPNGRELFYRGFGAAGGVYSATISSLSPFRVEPPRRLVELNTNEYDSTSPIGSWNVSPDGRRFLASRFEGAGQPTTTLTSS